MPKNCSRESFVITRLRYHDRGSTPGYLFYGGHSKIKCSEIEKEKLRTQVKADFEAYLKENRGISQFPGEMSG